MGLREIVEERGGFAATRELLALGATERMLTAAVRSAILARVRNGWYSTVAPHDPRFRAVRVGGRLTGLSAFATWGAWVWQEPRRVEIAVELNAARLRPARDVRVHYGTDAEAGTQVAVSIVEAMTRVVLDEPWEVAIPCLDWALATGRADRIDLERAILALPESARFVRDWVDESSQSVLESVARVRLRSAGYRVASQVRTGMLGAVDIVIEGVVALELDGRRFHESTFERDRRRDLTTTVEGLHVIRVSEPMLREEWEWILAAIDAGLTARRVGNSGVFLEVPHGKQRSHRLRWEVS